MTQIKVTGRLEYNYPLKKFTTWYVGGCADLVFWPKDIDDLVSFLSQVYIDNNLNTLDITWLGLGSNVLIRDKGIRGIVIITANALKNLQFLDNNEVLVGAVMPCPIFAKNCNKRRLTRAEFFAGIPGTIGGALAMNAGAFGGETWSIVKEVQMINRAGVVTTRSPTDFNISYRKVTKKFTKPEELEWFISGIFKLSEDLDNTGTEKITQLLKLRSERQPIGTHSGGSVFKNPPDNFAAQLIDSSNLKGFTIGGAQVSTKHANFIINDKSASASDIEKLILYIKQVVQQKFGVELVPEVHILGEI